MMLATAEEVIRFLDLQPLPGEGGFYAETYRSERALSAQVLPERYGGSRALSTAIYYLLTPGTCSALHRLKGDEIYHFYLGDPVEMLNLHWDGAGEVVVLGNDLAGGQAPQHVVPGGTWQGSRLLPGGKFALMGTTMAPGFDFEDCEAGRRDALQEAFPPFSDLIGTLAPRFWVP
jgi:uncharacterized protein